MEEYKRILRNYAADPEAHPLPLDRKGARMTVSDLLLPIANLSLHRTLYGQLFDVDHARLCFKRDWNIHGEQFRTTWTSGW